MAGREPLFFNDLRGVDEDWKLELDAQTLGHLVVQESFSRAVRLNPLSVDHKLWNGPFARALHNFFGRTGNGFDIDFLIRNIVLLQESFGLAAIRTPCAGIDDNFHRQTQLYESIPASAGTQRYCDCGS
jgi:hypothetical protein